MDISLIIPAYNEVERIGETLETAAGWFASQKYSAEIIVVDDGSSDDTTAIVREYQSRAPTPILLEALPENRGKGAAVQAGMVHLATGAFRFFYDADASTPIEEIARCMPLFDSGADIVIGSRALPDSQIEKRQVWYREFMGRCFNHIERVLRLTRFKDTQCGFKGFTARAAEQCFSRQTVFRFSFDVEILFIAEKYGLRVEEIPVRWINCPKSRVNPVTDAGRMFLDLIAIRAKDLAGKYD